MLVTSVHLYEAAMHIVVEASDVAREISVAIVVYKSCYIPYFRLQELAVGNPSRSMRATIESTQSATLNVTTLNGSVATCGAATTALIVSSGKSATCATNNAFCSLRKQNNRATAISSRPTTIIALLACALLSGDSFVNIAISSGCCPSTFGTRP